MITPKYKKQLVKYLADGLSTTEIAAKLKVSKRTLDRDLQVVKGMHNAKSSCHLVGIFFRDGLIK